MHINHRRGETHVSLRKRRCGHLSTWRKRKHSSFRSLKNIMKSEFRAQIRDAMRHQDYEALPRSRHGLKWRYY